MAINLEHEKPVYQTKDYDQFVHMRGNREISSNHVEQIKQSMRLHGNLLDLYPLVIRKERDGDTEKLVIHDGQHRFEAAKSLGLDIFYIIDGDKRLTIQTVIDANAAQKSWGYRDFLSSYCIREFPEYLKVRDYLTRYPMPIMTALQLLCGEDQNNWRVDFKRGNYKVRQWDYAVQVAEHCLAFSQYFSGAFHAGFVSALTMLMRNPHYKIERMEHKLPHGHHLLQKQSGVDDYFDMLTLVYNYHSRAENLEEFTQIDAMGRVKKAGRWVRQTVADGKTEAEAA